MTLVQPDSGPLDPTAVPGRGVLVVGMHRSGTSATTRVLNLAGLPLADADDLWLELPGNESGYWESASLSRFNERLLRRVGGTWWRPPDPAALVGLAGDPDLRRQAAQLFVRLHGTGAWVWKDPRVCLLLPFWRAVLFEPFLAVLVLRHPYEVASSLSTRDRLPWPWSLALWETYLRRALQGLAGLPVYVLGYDELLADPDGAVDGLASFAARSGLLVERPDGATLQGFLDGDLRHSSYDDSDLVLSGRTDLLDIAVAVRARAGAHASFVPPPLAPESRETAGTLHDLAALSADTTLTQALSGTQRTDDISEETAMTTERTTDDTTARDSWRTWIATNLMLGVDEPGLLAVLQQNGMPVEQATSEIADVRTEPSFQAGMRVAAHLHKLESVLDVRHDLEALDPRAGVVDHVPVVTRDQFLTRYYAANRPVMIEGLVDDWPALVRWDPQYLATVAPEAEIEVMVDRLQDPEYEINSEQHKSTMRMADYVAAVEAGSSNDIYMVANNHFLDHPDVAALWADFQPPEIYLDAEQAQGQVFFWFGPGGTVTPLHHDVINVLFVQVHGSKKVVLYSPLETHHVYNETGVYSSVDALDPDLTTYPRFARPTRHEVTVGPGQALFIPVGWWHCVQALETSISMSFTNFVFPNAYTWQHPDLRT